MAVEPIPCADGGSTPVEVTTCCSPSIASAPLCCADGSTVLLVVRSGCVECGEAATDPAVAGWIDAATGAFTAGAPPADVGPCAAGCCSPSITSATLCRDDGTSILVVVRSACVDCADDATDPVVVGWFDLAAGVFTAGAAPAGTGPCETGCVDTVCRQLCDDTDGDGAADATYSELWCVHADGTAELVLTYQDDPSVPYVPVAPVDCEYANATSEVLTLCDDAGPFLRRYSWLGDSATFEDVELDGVTPHVVTGTVGVCAASAAPDCEAATTPAATLGLCLASGTPIAVIVTRDCDGTVTQDGWINLTTGTYSAGDPPVGTMACGNPRSISTAGTFCDVDPGTGDVLGLVLVEYTYGADGAVESVRLVDAITGQTYVPQGEVTTCPAGVAQPERDILQLCDNATDGTVTEFVRDYARDENGAITGHTDYLLDGDPYTVTGDVGQCAAAGGDEEECCETGSTLTLCDVADDGTVTPFLRRLTYAPGIATPTVADFALDGTTPYTPVGTVGVCCEPPPPETRLDVETTLLCVQDTASGDMLGQVIAERVYDDQSGALVEQRLTDLAGDPFTLPAGAELAKCPSPDRVTRQVCVVESGRSEFLTNEANATSGQDPVWQWAPNLTGLWHPMYRVAPNALWTATDTAPNKARWVSPHANRTVCPTAGETSPPVPGTWYTRASWNLPANVDPDTIRIAATILNADNKVVQWRLNDGAWQPVGGGTFANPAWTFPPTAVPGGRAGQNEVVVQILETQPAASCPSPNEAGMILHVIATYDYEPQVWTQVIEPGGQTYYLDENGDRQDAVPVGHRMVPCGSGGGASTQAGPDTELLALCDTAADGTVTEFLRHFTYTEGAPVVVDTLLDGVSPYTPTGTVTRCQDDREPCRNASSLLLCDLPTDGTPAATVTDTDPTAFYPYPTGAPVSGAQPLWDGGGTLTIPAASAPQPGATGAVATLAATLQAARPACDAGTAHVTVSVDVTQLGPDTGCAATGYLRLFNGPASPVALAVTPNNAPPGWSGTLTVEADVPAADLAAGNIGVLVALDTYDDSPSACPGSPRRTGWDLAQFTAAVTYDQTGCAPQFLRTVTVDCETGAVIATSDSTLDGQPYTVTGDVGQCAPASGGGDAEPLKCGDTEIAQLCDLTYDPQAPIPTPAGDFTLTGNVVAANDGTTLWFAQSNQVANGVAELTVSGLLPAVLYEFRFASAWIGAGAPDPANNNATYLLEILDGTTVLATRNRNTSNGSNVFPGGVLTEDLPPLAFIAPATGAVTIRFTDQTTGGAINDRDLFLMPFEVRTAVLTVTSTPFLRRFTFDCDGNLTSSQDLGLDGATPYAVQGEVGSCAAAGGEGWTSPEAEPCQVQNVIERCRCDDTDGDGLADTGYVELIGVDCEGTLTSLGTYTDGLTAPYTPVAPVDCDALDDTEGADPAFGVQARRIELAPGTAWDVSAWPTLQSVTAVAHGGTGTITTADGQSTLHTGEAATWSVARDTDAALTGPLTIAADSGTVTIAFTTGVTL
ncbi:hypothetical protein [Streptomyces sp. NPDC005148]